MNKATPETSPTLNRAMDALLNTRVPAATVSPTHMQERRIRRAAKILQLVRAEVRSYKGEAPPREVGNPERTKERQQYFSEYATDVSLIAKIYCDLLASEVAQGGAPHDDT
jgi:hypothetical protein